MNGAERLVQAARDAGIEVCFANPGTTEMPLVAALDAVPGMRGVLGVFEGVCTGAADGYARMTGKPALTLLHLGPGFANGIANLHNARRAHSPVVNLIGDHATWHRAADAPLASDILSLARPVSGYVEDVERASEAGPALERAVSAALAPPGQVATLVLANDAQWDEAPVVSSGGVKPVAAARVPDARITAAVEALRGARAPVILLGPVAASEEAVRTAGRIAAATGARLASEVFPARLERGAGRVAVERIPYFPEQAREWLAAHDLLVRVGARDPVAFFGYRGDASALRGDATTDQLLAEPYEDGAAALLALADALGAGTDAEVALRVEHPAPDGALDPATLAAAIAATLPEDAILMDEGATSGLPTFVSTATAAPHTYLALTGGAIGQGLPCATGAAVACPDRKVLALQADGSGLYTLQALWTQARESLDVVTVLCSNRAYRILQIELHRAGIAEPGPVARSLCDLSRPEIDWTALARGFGVPASRVADAGELTGALRRAFAEPGPALIEVPLP